MGLCAAMQIASDLMNRDQQVPDPDTMCGALIRYITQSDPKHFQPMNANFGLLDPPEKKISKSLRKAWFSERALKTLKNSLPVAPIKSPLNTSYAEQQMSEKEGMDAA